MLKISTWNVNSIRARLKNFLQWARFHKPDVILLQEIKCTRQQFPIVELENLNYNIEIFGQKAHNGVAIMAKFPLYEVQREIFDDNGAVEARYEEAYLDWGRIPLKIVSVYAPNGGPSVMDINNGLTAITDTNSFHHKLKFFDGLREKLRSMVTGDEVAFVGGDYNICPQLAMDIYSSQKDGSITCTATERKKFKELLDIGMVDIWRHLHPQTREYSWWGYRPQQMWQKNQGYRLDMLLATPRAMELVKKCEIQRELRNEEHASDHVPVTCWLDTNTTLE
jgi:exodeoxyribonuclease-3